MKQAQVAASMINAAHNVDAKYPPVLKAVFIRRAILSLHSATSAALAPESRAALTAFAAPPAAGETALPSIALPAAHYGVEGLVFLEAASQPRPFIAMAAALDASPVSPSSGAAVAQQFVDDLFTRGRVDYGDAVPAHHRLDHGRKLKSHRLVKVEGGARLERVLFDCGYCHH